MIEGGCDYMNFSGRSSNEESELTTESNATKVSAFEPKRQFISEFQSLCGLLQDPELNPALTGSMSKHGILSLRSDKHVYFMNRPPGVTIEPSAGKIMTNPMSTNALNGEPTVAEFQLEDKQGPVYFEMQDIPVADGLPRGYERTVVGEEHLKHFLEPFKTVNVCCFRDPEYRMDPSTWLEMEAPSTLR
jgi:hypothetical protein